MNIEISKEQKANLSQKMSLCVEFLKKEIQPHLTRKDKIVLPAGDTGLELCITSSVIYINHCGAHSLLPDSLSLSIDIPFQHKYSVEKCKKHNKKDKNYICEACPEAAIEFLSHWDKIKTTLLTEVAEKNKKVGQINDFIDNFRL